MGLETVPLGRGLPVIAHGDGQEMELDIGVVHPRRRADERPQLSNWFDVPGPGW